MKLIISDYTFIPLLRQIDFSSYSGFDSRNLLAVINTTSNQLIYQVGSSANGLANVSGSLVTLLYDTTSMNASDKLQIHYDISGSNSSNQITANNSLSSIDVKLTNNATSILQSAGNTSLDNIDDNLGIKSDLVASTDTGTFSLISLFKRLLEKLTNVITVSVNNFPTFIGLTDTQLRASELPISASSLPLPTGSSTSMLQTIGNNLLSSIDSKITNGQNLSSLSIPVVISNEQSQDAIITGQAGQNTLGNNIFLSMTGTSSIDTNINSNVSYHSWYCQIIASAGISAGQIIFEGSNNNVNFHTLTWYDDNLINGTVSNGAIAIAANTNRFFSGRVGYRYIRCRISTAFVGGTVQAITRFSKDNYLARIQTISQATGTTFSTTISSSLPSGTATIGNVGIQYSTNATGASNKLHIVSENSTNATIVKASAGRVIGWSLANTTASFVFVKLHNQATLPTAGTSVFLTIAIPPNSVSQLTLSGGIAFSTGIGLTTVTGIPDADNTIVPLNSIVGEVFFS